MSGMVHPSGQQPETLPEPPPCPSQLSMMRTGLITGLDKRTGLKQGWSIYFMYYLHAFKSNCLENLENMCTCFQKSALL